MISLTNETLIEKMIDATAVDQGSQQKMKISLPAKPARAIDIQRHMPIIYKLVYMC